jgi:hypothetical protein
MENLLTQYNQGLARNQTRGLVVINLVFFRFVISGSAVKLPPHKKGLPGDEISCILFPLYPPARRAYGELAGSNPSVGSIFNYLEAFLKERLSRVRRAIPAGTITK